MKKFLLIAMLSLFCFALVPQVKAQKLPTKNLIYNVIKKKAITNNNADTKIDSATFLFFPNYNVEKIQIQVDYLAIMGVDSIKIYVYSSASVDFISITATINTISNLLWKSSQGKNVCKFDAVDLSGKPTAYIKIVIQSYTAIKGTSSGSVNIFCKPYFK